MIEGGRKTEIEIDTQRERERERQKDIVAESCLAYVASLQLSFLATSLHT
jgi:hypothetical protein